MKLKIDNRNYGDDVIIKKSIFFDRYHISIQVDKSNKVLTIIQ